MRTSGSTCARTGSRTACSKPTKRSSKRPATLGVASSPSPPPSPQSATAAGRTSVRNKGRWYKQFPRLRDARANLVLTLTGRGVEATSSTLTFDASDAYIATGLLGLEAVANGLSRPRADWATWARARCERALAPESCTSQARESLDGGSYSSFGYCFDTDFNCLRFSHC